MNTCASGGRSRSAFCGSRTTRVKERRSKHERARPEAELRVTKTESDTIEAFCLVCSSTEALIHNWQETEWASGMMEPVNPDPLAPWGTPRRPLDHVPGTERIEIHGSSHDPGSKRSRNAWAARLQQRHIEVAEPQRAVAIGGSEWIRGRSPGCGGY